MHRWCLLNLTVQGFSLNLTVRGVSNKHCLLTFFIFLNQCTLLLFSFLQKCVTEDPNNLSCQYMQALSEVAIGQFYNGVKTATKVGLHDQH